MKKNLAMFATLLIVATSAQASAVNWNSGTLYAPVDASGTFSGTRLDATTGAGYTAVVSFFLADGTTPFAVASGTEKTGASALGKLNATTSTEFAIGATYWAFIHIEDPTGQFYMDASVSFTIPGTGAGSANFTMPSSWTAVPEPATMALLGIGVVAVGLRRRRK